MQRKALKELNRYRAVGSNRALVVAAAGSGKTYLAAFDTLNFNPERLLYVVHEESILKKSLETFQNVFGSTVSCGIYSGTSKESDADFVFATNLTMCKTLELFRKDEFDYIIGMDTWNIRNINRMIGNGDPQGKVSKLLDFTERKGQDIADPWYTGDFDETYRDVKEGCEALLQDCLLRL